ncbi:hypothetical protein, partial [Cellulosimicrobium funkei]
NVGAGVTGGGALSTAGTTRGADAPVTLGMGAAALGEWAGYGAVVALAAGCVRGWAATRAGGVSGGPSVPGVFVMVGLLLLPTTSHRRA